MKTVKWFRGLFAHDNKQSVAKETKVVANYQKIKPGNLIKVKANLSPDLTRDTIIWELPSNCPGRNQRSQRANMLVPDFHRAEFKMVHLTSSHPAILYLGSELHTPENNFYHPESFTAHFFLHKGTVWFKTSSHPDSHYESFILEEMFEPIFSEESCHDR